MPVKKQRKYNLSRWAVTGRDDIGVNAACERIYRAMADGQASDADWKELCALWASDFRTHITEKRWNGFCARLAEAEAKWVAIVPDPNNCHSRPAFAEAKRQLRAGRPGMTPKDNATTEPLPRYLDIATPSLRARIDRRRGLAIGSLAFAGDARAVVGGLPHGHFDDIALQADWYTGDCVFEAPGEHKITDLEWCTPQIAEDTDGSITVAASIPTPRGPILKTLRFHATAPRVDFDLVFRWENFERGSLRLGHITLLPDAFDWSGLSLTTHNGGKDCETFSLNAQAVDHGAPVSFLVSASYGFGMTEGWAELGDAKTRIRVDVDRETAPLLGLLSHRALGGSLFCQLVLSALELDETRKPKPYRAGPRRFRFSLTRVAT